MIDPERKRANLQDLEAMTRIPATGASLPSLDQVVSLSKVEPVKDQWYFSIECPNCLRMTAAFRDFSDGKLGNPFSGRGGIRTNCHFCSAHIEAAAERMAAFRWWEGESRK